MGFASASKRVIQTIAIPIDGGAAGGADIKPEWVLPFTGDQSPRDMAKESDVLFANTTLVSSPEVYFDQALDDIQVLGRGLRMSADLRGREHTFAINPNRGSQLTLLQPSQGSGPNTATIPLTTEVFLDATAEGTHQYVLRWGVTAVTVTGLAIPENAWFRIGVEVLPDENIVRGYINLTAGDIGVAGNAGLQARAQVAFDSAGVPLPGPFFIGTGHGNTSATTPSAAMPNFSGTNDILVELFEGPVFSPGNKPTGTYFQDPASQSDPYRFYKSSIYIHDLLTQARIL